MKKMIFWPILFMLLVVSCSKDDVDLYQPRAGEIKLVFDASSDNSEAFFYIRGKGIRINWGDGKSEDKEFASLSKISHQYSTLDKEYIITLNYTSIEEFGNTDNSAIFAYRTIGSKYKLMAFGEGVQIPKLYFESDLGSALNVSSTSKFNDVYLLLADNEFDLGCFENKTIGFLEIRVMTHGRNVDLNNMKIGRLNIVLHETTPIGSITINSCRNMAGFNCYGRYRKGNVFASMGDLIINDAPELFFFNFDYLDATGLLINEADKLRDVVLWASSVRGPIKFSNSIEKLTIAESIEIENGITSLDVSNCTKLKDS